MINVPTEFRIITIDDNPAIHNDFIKILKAKQNLSKLDILDQQLFDTNNEITESVSPIFHIDSANQGHEGLEQIKQALAVDRPYALAFVDIRMPPGWDGVETIKHIWEVDKNIQCVICTAFSDYTWEKTIAELGINDNLIILKKPFDNIAVRQLTCALTKKWQLIQESSTHMELLENRIQERTKSLQESVSLMRATFESSADGLIVVDNNNIIIEYNNNFVTMWGIPEQVLDSKQHRDVLDFQQNQLQKPKEFNLKIQQLTENPNLTSIDILKFKEGKIYERYSQPYKLNTKIIGRVWSFRDVTQRAYLEQTLEYHATHDSLTDLPNRLLLLDRLRQSIEIASRHKTLFAVFFIDLDRFKVLNDSISHEAGDQLLQAVSERLRLMMRKEDTIARLGGDEFVMIIPDLLNENEITKVANKVQEVFTKPFNIANRNIIMTGSIGISIYPKDGTDVNELLRNADLAMYYAKDHGGNQFYCYTEELSRQNVTYFEMESELRNAIANNEFQLVYQPQFNLTKSEMISVEALIRWHHPSKGIIFPNDFIPLAEKTGMIIQIGEWVMRVACMQNKAWQDLGLPPFRVAVNVATQQLKQANFATVVKNILDETGLKPEYLEIEITENVVLSSNEVVYMIDRLNEIGVQIVLDDFGTGNSSLNHLKKISINRLKIDQSFVQNIALNRSDEVIIKAILAMGQNLNFDVVAEGVESQQQLDFLKNLSCKEVQGYYFSKPLGSEELQAFFTNFIKKN